MYEGYTYEELCKHAGGGGGKGGTAPAQVAPMQTTTSGANIANLLGGQSERYDEKEALDKEVAVNTKKMGTRGLQIPLDATSSATAAAGTGKTSSPQTTGVNI